MNVIFHIPAPTLDINAILATRICVCKATEWPAHPAMSYERRDIVEMFIIKWHDSPQFLKELNLEASYP